jgi:curved DNA-binding protein CbpA
MHGAQRGEDPVPRLAPGCQPTRLALSPQEGFLLSRIDGATPVSLLRTIGGIPAADVDRCLARWVREGIVVLAATAAPYPPKAPSPPPSASAESRPVEAPAPEPPAADSPPAAPTPAAAVDESLLDPTLEISLELQRQVLEFETGLDRPYHVILGIPPDADAKAVKKAYFALSRVYHPDRYFRRNLGPFARRIDGIFKRILEAYELLSDPMVRAELQRSLAAQPAAPAAAPPGPPPVAEPEPAAEPAETGIDPRVLEERVAAAREARKRLSSRLSLLSGHRRALEERRRKAKGFFETGMAAFRAERWLEAAGSVRLALAFDPWNEVFKESFVDVQRKAHEERAKALIKEADAAADLREWREVLRLLEEALTFRPFDAELHHRAGKLAWQAAGDHRKAKEYVAAACELDPGKAVYRRTLGLIYKEAGLKANARRELEAALRLAPGDREIRAELKSL